VESFQQLVVAYLILLRDVDTLVERDLWHCGHSTTCPLWSNITCRLRLRMLAYVLIQPGSVHLYTSILLSDGWASLIWLRSKHGLMKVLRQNSQSRTTHIHSTRLSY